MKKYYCENFKMQIVNTIKENGESINKMAEIIGVKPITIYRWIKKYREDEEVIELKIELRKSKEEVKILKKLMDHFAKNKKS